MWVCLQGVYILCTLKLFNFFACMNNTSYLCNEINQTHIIMKKRKLLLSAMTIFVINAHACFMYGTTGQTVNDVNPTKSNGPIRKAPARRPVSVFVTDSQNLELAHVCGCAQFTYYIYDETGGPVMSGSGEFDADGLFNVAIDTLPSGHYTVEVVINGSANLCSFFKM